MKFRGHLLAIIGSLCLVLGSGGAIATHADVNSNTSSAEASSAVDSTMPSEQLTTPDGVNNQQGSATNSEKNEQISTQSQSGSESSPQVSYSTHVSILGWTPAVNSGTISGKIAPT